jgi:hypothetical protein
MGADSGVPDLSITLYPVEREELVARGGDPEEYLGIDFPIVGLQAATAGPKGVIFIAQFVVPTGTFEFLEKRNSIVGPDGKAQGPDMSAHVGLPTILRLVMKKTSFTEPARNNLAKMLLLQQQAHEQRQGLMDKLLKPGNPE